MIQQLDHIAFLDKAWQLLFCFQHLDFHHRVFANQFLSEEKFIECSQASNFAIYGQRLDPAFNETY
jgi:hypothetical protein